MQRIPQNTKLSSTDKFYHRPQKKPDGFIYIKLSVFVLYLTVLGTKIYDEPPAQSCLGSKTKWHI